MIKVARANKLFGTDGGMMLTLYSDFPDDFDLATPLFAEVDSLYVPLYCERFEFRGTNGAVVRFDDIDTPRRAEEFVGRVLYVEEPDGEVCDDEFCMEDLIGFEVEAGGLHGRLADYYDSEANPLFGIAFDGRDDETLVPAVEEFIVHIDFEGRRMKMILPDGLLDL